MQKSLLKRTLLVGTKWGEDGYVRIIRGKDECGILNGPPVPPESHRRTVFLRSFRLYSAGDAEASGVWPSSVSVPGGDFCGVQPPPPAFARSTPW